MRLDDQLYYPLKRIIFPYKRLLEAVPRSGSILDIGCGVGYTLKRISEKGIYEKIEGIDWDPRKLKAARRNFQGMPGCEFRQADISGDFLPEANVYSCILLIDVLYYLSSQAQEKLLAGCFSALKQGGILLIKDLGRSRDMKFFASCIQEFLAVKVFRFTTAGCLNFRSMGEMSEMLIKAGFNVSIRDISRGYLSSHIIYKCEKII